MEDTEEEDGVAGRVRGFGEGLGRRLCLYVCIRVLNTLLGVQVIICPVRGRSNLTNQYCRDGIFMI